MREILGLIKKNEIKSFLDIGANVGTISLFVQSHCTDMDIFMIEANPKCDVFLKRTGIPYAISCLSDSKRDIDFFIENSNDIGTGASYYLEKTPHYSQKKSIRMATDLLDNVIFRTFGYNKSFDLIKLDTQGSEIDILKGGLKTVQNTKCIISEVSTIEYNENAPLKKDFFEFMSTLGFNATSKICDHIYDYTIIQEDWIFERERNTL